MSPDLLLASASPTLHERLLGKIVMAGPATPCAVWVGAYSHGRRRDRGAVAHRRPVIRLGARGSAVMYVTRLLLILAGVQRDWARQLEACHRCPTGTPPDGVYRCVDLAHLRWGTREENEADKRGGTTDAAQL